MTAFLLLACATLLAYILGSVSFSFLAVRWRTGQDLRRLGTGNLGARNAGRTLGWRYFLVVFLGDAGKAALAVYLGARLGQAAGHASIGELLAFVFVLTGHCFSCFLGFQGGKGLASAVGALAVLSPAMLLFTALVAGLVLVATRSLYVAPAVAALALPVIALLLGRSLLFVVFAAVAGGLVFYRHLPNLRS